MFNALLFLAPIVLAAYAGASAIPASVVGKMTNDLSVLTSLGNIVRIHDNSGLGWGVDPGYPEAPDFTPVNGLLALPTTTPTNQDWVLVPVDTGTFNIESAMFPGMFISYASFGIDSTEPIHSQLVLRGSSNAAIFSLETISGGQTVNIAIPAINKVISSWTTTLTDTTTPITVTNVQAASIRQIFQFVVIA
ncbi:hypothetical protein FB45DRAFT_919887 [Roridomyces roridus]|uniref:Uncharacterized protein n=1 Tax=Roridomyces roridus TaxID=1738132 RepID=A0AAD7BS68_9AGAR|nr:hypothetical protein FB45DRAFT_919887 [Roridomyces roridus]